MLLINILLIQLANNFEEFLGIDCSIYILTHPRVFCFNKNLNPFITTLKNKINKHIDNQLEFINRLSIHVPDIT